MKRADCIIVVTELMKKTLIGNSNGKYNHKIHVIYNGYDRDDFKDVKGEDSPHCKKVFDINYVGTWGQSTSPMFFSAALKELLTKYKYLNNKIRVNFVGEVKWDPVLKDQIDSYIKDNELEGVFNWIEFLPHKEALRYLLNANLLLLVIGQDKQKSDFYKHRVTSKLLEYLYVQRPILGLVPSDSEPAKIIRECDAGEIVNPENTEEIARAIYKMYYAWKENKLHYEFEKVEISKYDRRKQTKQLSAVFDSIAKKS